MYGCKTSFNLESSFPGPYFQSLAMVQVFVIEFKYRKCVYFGRSRRVSLGARVVSSFIFFWSHKVSVSIFHIYLQKRKSYFCFFGTLAITTVPKMVTLAMNPPLISSKYWPKCPISGENTWLATHGSYDYLWFSQLWQRGWITWYSLAMFILSLWKGELLTEHGCGWEYQKMSATLFQYFKSRDEEQHQNDDHEMEL